MEQFLGLTAIQWAGVSVIAALVSGLLFFIAGQRQWFKRKTPVDIAEERRAQEDIARWRREDEERERKHQAEEERKQRSMIYFTTWI